MTTRRALAPAVLCAGVSALLLNLSYFPVGWGWLAWVALAPWLILVRADLRNRDRYLLAWLSALAFFMPALRWMRVAHEAMFYSWIGLSLACSWFAPLALWLIRRLDRSGWPLILSVPVVWTALEYVRTHLFGGFPWYLLGHSQHAVLPLIQVADLAGAPAVTFLVAAVNGLIAEALMSRVRVQSMLQIVPRSVRFARQIAIVGIAIVAVFIYGYWRIGQANFTDGPTVALLQTDLEQATRNNRPDDGSGAASRSIQDIRAQTAELTKRAAKLQPPPDLIIWPETTFEYDYKARRNPPPDDPKYRAWAEDIADRDSLFVEVANLSRTTVLLGLNAQEFVGPDRIDRFNSALMIDIAGKPIVRYDKTHLVPFGEYVPLYETFPILKNLAPYDEAIALLTPGAAFPRMTVSAHGRNYSFGCMICYEDSYANLAREYLIGQERPVDFLVNQSNDGWFKCTHEHEEHLAVSRFRAIECRRSLVRAANMGISAIIDGNGEIRSLPGPSWRESKGLMAVVSGAVPIDDRTSFYARTGDLLPWFCWGAILYSIARPRRSARP